MGKTRAASNSPSTEPLIEDYPRPTPILEPYDQIAAMWYLSVGHNNIKP
jgi:hypothetical protein